MKTRQMELSEITKVIDPIVGILTDQWYLISATDKEGTTNTLTAAWGGFGNVCGVKTATVYIRPQRYTKKFMDESGYFTMTFFDFETYKEALQYLGRVSGKDVPDKIEKAGLTVTQIDGQPTFEEGKYVIVCRTVFVQQLSPEHFVDTSIRDKAYPNKDYSYMYIGEIVGAYEIL